MPDLAEQITALVAAQMGLQQVSINDLIVEDLGAESMDIVNIIAALEERFGIQISEDELAGLRRIGDLLELLEAKKTA